MSPFQAENFKHRHNQRHPGCFLASEVCENSRSSAKKIIYGVISQFFGWFQTWVKM